MSEKSKSQYDQSLNELVEKDSLAWLPWVGSRYDEHRILLVGESHYDSHKKEEDWHLQRSYTRDVIQELAIENREHKTPFFSNVARLLTGQSSSREVWHDVAFMNHVQRIMRVEEHEGKELTETPTNMDFYYGWVNMFEVMRVLRPKVVVYLGVAASNTFEFAAEKHGVIKNPMFHYKEQINRTYVRRAKVETDFGDDIPLYFIAHPSAYFSWEKWRDFLLHRKALQEFLNHCETAYAKK